MSDLNYEPRFTLKTTAVIQWFGAFLWWCFLALLVTSSFLVEGYDSKSWLLFSALFYLWFCAALIVSVLSAKIHWQAVSSSKSVIALLLLSLCWLWLQTVLLINTGFLDYFNSALTSGISSPQWFEPQSRWSVTPIKTRWLLMSETLFFFMFISTVVMVRSRRRLKHILWVFAVICLAHASIGLVGKFTNVVLVDIKQLDGHYSAARGFFINRNHFASLIALTLCGALAYQIYFVIKHSHYSAYQLIKAQLFSRALVPFVLIMLGLVSIVSGESRGALFSIFAAALLALFLLIGNDRQFLKRFLGPLLVLAVVAAGYFGQELVARLGNDSLSIGERSEQWVITLRAIIDNPIFGYGGGSYSTVFQAYRVDDSLRQVMFAQSHNYFLHTWLERGVVGLLLWVAIIIVVVLRVKQAYSQQASTFVRAALFGVLICLLAAIIQSLVDYNLQVSNIRGLFMVLIGVVCAAPFVKHRK